MRLFQKADTNAVLDDELFQFQLPAVDTVSVATCQPQDFFPRLSHAAQPHSATKGTTVLWAACGRASPAGCDKAAERKEGVSSTQTAVEKFRDLRSPWLIGCWVSPLGTGGFESTKDTSGQAGLNLPPAEAACCSVPSTWRMKWECGWAYTERPEGAVASDYVALARTQLLLFGEDLAGTIFGAGCRV